MTKSANLVPRLSEKTYGLSNARVYAVDVSLSASKPQIKRAIEERFSVKVIKINTTNIIGKSKRTISKGGRRVSKGSDNQIKKAYFTLADKQSLPFFEAVEE